MKSIVGKLIVWSFCALGWFLAHIPHRFFLGFVYALSALMRLLDRRRGKDAMANLNFVYPTMSLEEKKAIIKRCYQNFSFVLLESARALYMPKEAHLARFHFENLHYLQDIVAQEEGFVLLSAHFGYWEAMANALPQFAQGYGMYSLGRLTQFDAVNEMIIQSRENYGVKLINKKGSLKQLLKIYTQPKQAVGILVDQNMSESEAVWVEFFGKEVTHSPVASILSRRYNIPILPVYIDFNEDYTQFFVKFCAPFKTPNTHDMDKDLLEATQIQASLTQEAIQSSPSSWFWFHKRFKAKYPEIYS